MEVGRQIQSLLCGCPPLSPLLASPAGLSLPFYSDSHPARWSSDCGSQGQAQGPSVMWSVSPHPPGPRGIISTAIPAVGRLSHPRLLSGTKRDYDSGSVSLVNANYDQFFFSLWLCLVPRRVPGQGVQACEARPWASVCFPKFNAV